MDLADTVCALLFVASSPSGPRELATALNVAEGQVEQALEVLAARLEKQGPLELKRLAGGWQLCTKPEYADHIAAFLKPQRQRLGRSLLEVLAIVAYKQPVTLADIDAARGVQSDYGVRQLVERGLLRELGRRKSPGRPILFGTTSEFLHQFNLNDLSELPPVTAHAPDPLMQA